MKAMVLAAGLGTRLRPLTEDRPKALVEIDGRTLLELTLERLKSFGVRQAIVNVHHFADKIVDCLQAHGNFGMEIAVSREHELLDTGGGLKKAAWFFEGEQEPFVLHNVDVLSSIDLDGMRRAHQESGALATLAVRHRQSSRLLLFDAAGRLCGRRVTGEPDELARETMAVEAFGFCGVHVISPELLGKMRETGRYAIIAEYLRLAGAGTAIAAHCVDDAYWRDLGTHESLAQAGEDLRAGRVKA